MERNLCAESGCPAACCQGPKIHFKELTREQLLKYWPKAKDTPFVALYALFNRKGVYFTQSGNGFNVDILGYCPNVDREFNCGLQNDKPEPCREFGLGQKDCILFRQDHSLPTYREWAYNQNTSSSPSSKPQKEWRSG